MKKVKPKIRLGKPVKLKASGFMKSRKAYDRKKTKLSTKKILDTP